MKKTEFVLELQGARLSTSFQSTDFAMDSSLSLPCAQWTRLFISHIRPVFQKLFNKFCLSLFNANYDAFKFLREDATQHRSKQVNVKLHVIVVMNRYMPRSVAGLFFDDKLTCILCFNAYIEVGHSRSLTMPLSHRARCTAPSIFSVLFCSFFFG